MRKKPIKPGTIPAIRRDCDRLWREAVMARSDGRCEVCGNFAYCGHHIFTRGSSLATRWDMDNGIALCIRCHYAVHSSNLGQEYMLRILEVVGAERMERVRARHHEKVHWRKADFEAIRDGLAMRKAETGTFS